jgi:hypothetical protein
LETWQTLVSESLIATVVTLRIRREDLDYQHRIDLEIGVSPFLRASHEDVGIEEVVADANLKIGPIDTAAAGPKVSMERRQEVSSDLFMTIAQA